MAKTEIQTTIRGRSIGLSRLGHLVVNLVDKTQLVVSPTGILYTDNNGNTTTISGGSGASAYVDLTDAASAALPTVNTALSAALAAKASTASVAAKADDATTTAALALKAPLAGPTFTGTVSGVTKTHVGLSNVDNTSDASKPISSAQATVNTAQTLVNLTKQDLAPLSIAYATTIPLDTTGNGKTMPQTQLVANSTFTVSGAVENGNCNFSLLGDGTHAPDLAAFVIANGYTYDTTTGANNIYSAVRAYGTNLLFGVAGTAVDLTPPTLTSAAVADATPTRITLTWSEAISSTVSASSAFTVSSGHTLTGHTYVDSTHSYLTTSTPFIQGETKTLSYTQPGSNKMQDLAGNLTASFSGTAITDNVTTPTLVSATVSNATPTHIDLVWSESMNSTVPASSTFTVSSGHTLTAHTYVTATTSYLTTSAAFINGESAKTLSYTPSGTNDMKDSAGGNLVAAFSGTAISNNVGAGFTDDFNRTDSPGALGSPWVNQSGTASISSNKAVSDGACIVTRPGTANGSFQFTSVVPTNVLVYRFVDTSNYWAFQWTGSLAQLYKVVAGSATTVISDTSATGTVMKAVYSGNSHSIYMDGVQVGTTITDSDLASGTGVGFRAYANDKQLDDAVCT